MSIGYVFLFGAWAIWVISGVIYGFGEIVWFGVLMAVITGVLAIRNYRLKRK